MYNACKDSEGSVPEEYNEFMLMIEWGLAPEQFNTLPQNILGRILEYRRAEGAAQIAANKKQK